jgi:hypothetical protein
MFDGIGDQVQCLGGLIFALVLYWTPGGETYLIATHGDLFAMLNS